MFFAIATMFQGKYPLMGKNSVSCHGITALVYSPASILDPEGLTVTCWHHFIHLVENKRRVACSFMILSHLARFLSLLVCLTPTAWKIEYIFPVLSLFFCLGVCVLQLQTPTHKNICLHTEIYMRGCLWPLSACPLLEKRAKLLYLSSMSPAATNTSSWYHSLLDWVVPICRVSQQIREEGLSAVFVYSQSQTMALWWVTCKEEMTVRDTKTYGSCLQIV